MNGSASMIRPKVLLIDDSEVALHFASRVLDRAGYEVRTTDDVNQLSGVLGGWRPDVILTDVEMPGLSGLELCRMLKSNYDTAHVPVVLFSALAPGQLEEMARECEADGFLSKANGLDQLPKELALLIDTSIF
jgi:two-component system cell cycle response regulator DivK